eukprot:COSAG01_NODE_20581_length_947_cov_0.811321_2_plen_197_part_01
MSALNGEGPIPPNVRLAQLQAKRTKPPAQPARTEDTPPPAPSRRPQTGSQAPPSPVPPQDGSATVDNPLGAETDHDAESILPVRPAPSGESGENNHGDASPPASAAFLAAHTPEWLQRLEENCMGTNKIVAPTCTPVWSLVFELHPPGCVTEECQVMIERIVAADLQIQHFFSRDQDEIFVTVGATENILMEEATFH